jgi:hypothetical protein
LRPTVLARGAAAVTAALSIGCGPGSSSMAGSNDLNNEGTWAFCDVGPPAVRMGSADGQGDYLFFGVEGGRFLPDGGVAVLNRYSQEVRLFSSEGRFIQALGGRGDGPGELRDPISIDLVGSDSLAVWDWSQGRVTIFDLSEESSRSILLDPPVVNPTGSFGVADVSGGPSTFLVGSNPLAHFGGDTEGGDQLLHVLEYSSAGDLIDTVRVLPYGRSLWVDQANREVGRPWFQPQGLFRVEDGVLYTATGDSSQIEITDLADSSSSRVLRWTAPDREVRPEHLEAHRLETFQRFEGNEYLTQRLQRIWNTVPSSSRFPALDGFIPDDVGRTWIKQYPRPGQAEQVWWRFGVDGGFQCAARFPTRFEPLAFREESVLGLLRDSLDIELIEVRSLDYGGGR